MYDLPWTPPIYCRGPSVPSDLTRQTIFLWDHMISALCLSKYMGSMTPFFGTPSFLPALYVAGFDTLHKQEHGRLIQVLQSDSSLCSATPERSR